jgi:catalase
MTPVVKEDEATAFSRKVIQAFDNVNGGVHPGYRPAHAKGILLSGVFTPSPGGSSLTRALHLHRESTPLTLRFSDFAGVPSIPDGNENASPRGIAIRFHLAEHVHTDILGHSANGFPTRTAEELVEFLQAVGASGPGASKPLPIEVFLGSHPAALRFVQIPKPIPTSFAKESFYGVSAYKFIDQTGAVHFGRYRICPDGAGDYLSPEAAAAKSANFLFDEIKERLAKGPAKLHIAVQLAEAGDIVDDSTVLWPEDRPKIEFGTVQIDSVAGNNEPEQRQIIFDPIPRVDGIDSSGDPLLEPRASVYLMSGRRRRAGGTA